VYASAGVDRAPGSFLKVTQSLFGSTQYLALQTAQHLLSASQHVACLFLNLSNEAPYGTVDLVCVHAGLSREK
jgi:hypothetical protein